MDLERKYSALMEIIRKHKITDIDTVETCFYLLSAGKKIDKKCADRLGKHQLSEGRFMILALLLEYKVLSPQEIAKLSGVTKATMTSLISSLSSDNLIKKTTAPTDGRKFEITLTLKGEALINEVFKSHSVWISGITKNLTNPEMKQLIQLLKKIFQNGIEESNI